MLNALAERAAGAAEGSGDSSGSGAGGKQPQQQQDGEGGEQQEEQGADGSGGGSGGKQEGSGGAGAYAHLPKLKDPRRDLAQRLSPELLAAFIDSEVAGRRHHRGSGERHFARPDTYPAFEGRSLEEFDATSEGELSALARRAAEEEDDIMWREFRERLLHGLGLVRRARQRGQREGAERGTERGEGGLCCRGARWTQGALWRTPAIK